MSREPFELSDTARISRAPYPTEPQPPLGPDADGDWPIFLSRRVPPSDAEAPPPLPVAKSAFVRVAQASLTTNAVLGGCLTLSAIAGVSGLMLSDGQRRFDPPVTVRALHAPDDTVASIEAKPEIAPDHVRFAFAARLPNEHATVAAAPAEASVSETPEPPQNEPVIATSVEPNIEPNIQPGLEVALASPAEPRAADDTSDPVAVMILRNLPDTAAFLAGAASADGAWVIAANEFDHVVVTALTPNADPVSADAELISRSGLSLGVVRLPVRPSAPFMTAASEPEVPEAEPVSPDAAATAAAAPETAKVRVHVRKTVSLADAGHKPKRRSKHIDDAAKSKDRQPDKGQPNSDASATETAAAADAKPKGPISKFFAWIAGKSKPADAGAEDKGSAFSLVPPE